MTNKKKKKKKAAERSKLGQSAEVVSTSTEPSPPLPLPAAANSTTGGQGGSEDEDSNGDGGGDVHSVAELEDEALKVHELLDKLSCLGSELHAQKELLQLERKTHKRLCNVRPLGTRPPFHFSHTLLHDSFVLRFILRCLCCALYFAGCSLFILRGVRSLFCGVFALYFAVSVLCWVRNVLSYFPLISRKTDDYS
jgi:hypothetical protein